MSEEAARPIPVTMLTGFLGSGKTSLLKRLLHKPELSDTAVIINEFGEVGLDHLLVESADDDMVLLKSGCICCTIRGDLKESFLALFERRHKGDLPPFSRIVLESTGLADPAPIMATLLHDPMLKHRLTPGAIVTIVDGVAGRHNIEAFPESVRQVAAADRLVISKVDLASAEEVSALETVLTRLNPAAEIIHSDEERDPEETLISGGESAAGVWSGKVAQWAGEQEHAGSDSEDEDGAHGHVGHEHHHDVSAHGDIRAFVIHRTEPVDWVRFALWLSMLLNRHGTEVLRLKGLLRVTGVDTPVVIQGVQHMIHSPVHLDHWPNGEVPGTRLVIIARGLDQALIRRSFDAFMGGGSDRLGQAADNDSQAAE